MADPQSRFTLVSEAVRSPGYDWVTRAISGPMVDTGVDIQFKEFGRLYLSIDTIRELADVAGILDEEKQVGVIAHETALYNEGYAAALKENDFGQLSDLLGRLQRVLDLAADSPHPVGDLPVEAEPTQPAPASSDDRDLDTFEPEVLVTDGPELAVDSARVNKAAPRAVRAGGQGNGTRGKRRPAGVPAGASDVNPFRI